MYQPPKLYRRLFEWFCSDEFFEELQGDLEESFIANIEQYGPAKAKALYKKEVLNMIRPSVIKRLKRQNTHNNNIDMLSNYLKIGLRNIKAQKLYSVINILGLAVGMAATMLIALYVNYELSFDQYHSKSDRIYRMSREWLNQNGETSLHLGHAAYPFATHMSNDFDGMIEEIVRIRSGWGPVMQYEEKVFVEDNLYFAEGNVFKVFDWKLLEGNPKEALVNPSTAVMTREAAHRYFGDESPIGKSILYKSMGNAPIEITGILDDIPSNSHFTFDILVSFASIENAVGIDQLMQAWGGNNYSTYVLLKEGRSIEELHEQIPAFIDKHLGSNPHQAASETNKLHFLPIADIHLHSHLDSEIGDNSDIQYIYICAIIALFILVIACINFMNLSTARSMKRSREVGVRKVMGAFRTGLIKQFITESILIATVSGILAVALTLLILPSFNEFARVELSLSNFNPLFLIGSLIVVILSVGLLAGSYPAFFLSSFQPAKVLKGEKLNAHRKVNLRSALVVFQFFISICLLIGVGVINDQLDYLKSKDLGFDKENLIVVYGSQYMYDNFDMVKNRFEQQPEIQSVTLASRIPSGRLNDSQGGQAEVNGEMKNIDFRIADVHVDHNFLNTLNVKFIAGRNFDSQLASDSSEAFILNKASIDGLGYSSPEAAIGKKFNYGGRNGYITGVVEDFHFESLHQKIAPIVFMVTNGRGRNMIVKTTDEAKTIDYLKSEWEGMQSPYPFDYYTIGERFNEQYVMEEKLSELINYFAWLAIFIAVLGLFGLSSYSAEQHIKEIGIRKVLGASVTNVVYLFTKRFAVLVIIGLIIAIPVSYFGMSSWLENFPYSTSVQPITFIISGLVALALAIATVSYEIIKASYSNPVSTLRND